jgi:hypothetical protein
MQVLTCDSQLVLQKSQYEGCRSAFQDRMSILGCKIR